MDIEPLLARLETLAPSFGRAQHDIQAMVTRGRSADYKGVMQNCRLVLEALLRALVSDQLKQTPGKAMLDELITRFRQQANAGVIPTNVLAHMGTVQAWGNLSSHDHATKLSDDGVKVGKLEVMASLNSMVAILEWYATAFGSAPVVQPRAMVPAPIVHETRKPLPSVPIAIGAAALALGGVVFFLMTRPAALVVAEPVVTPFVALDAVYAERGEPVPPAACRKPSEADALAKKADDLPALEAIKDPSPEASYLAARLQVENGIDAMAATTRALSCKGFAAAYNVAGKIAVKDNRFADALPSYRAAVDLDPDFNNARYNLGLLYLQKGEVQQGIRELQRVVEKDKKFTDAFFVLGVAYEQTKQPAEARAAFCEAFKQGKTEAKDRCER